MDYGHTNQTNLAESELALRRRAEALAKQGVNPAVEEAEDPFASAITSGAGLIPEDIGPNPQPSPVNGYDDAPSFQSPTSLDRSSQLSLGATALEPMLPPEQPVEIDATKIANYDPTMGPELLNPAQTPQNQIPEAPVAPKTSEISEQPKENPQETAEAFIKIGQHFTGHDVAKIENAIRSAGKDIDSFYDLIQNTREEQK